MDGRSFSYQLSIGSTVPPPGGFVALVDGGAFVRFGARVSEEGGSDVPTDWARTGT